VAIHIIKNEDKDNTSNVMDNDSVNGEPGRFVTYAEIGYGITSVVFELGEIVNYLILFMCVSDIPSREYTQTAQPYL
jgi:hypothetical protein